MEYPVAQHACGERQRLRASAWPELEEHTDTARVAAADGGDDDAQQPLRPAGCAAYPVLVSVSACGAVFGSVLHRVVLVLGGVRVT
eukprot:2497038-Rhodomonas_salina.1